MRKKFFKMISIMVAIVLLISMFAGCRSDSSGGTTTTSASTTRTTTQAATTTTKAPTESVPESYKVEFMHRDSWLYLLKEDWPALLEVSKLSGVEIDITIVPWEGYDEKLNLLASTNNLPDIVTVTSAGVSLRLGLEGLLLPIDEQFDKLPNFKEKHDEYYTYLQYLYASDQKLYIFPKIVDRYLMPTSNAISIRADRFEEAGILEVPKTWEDLYSAMKTIKSVFPDDDPTYFPLVNDIITTWSYMFGSGPLIYFNASTNEWTCGPIEDNSRKMIKWLADAYKDELTELDFIKPDTQRQSNKKLGVQNPISVLFENVWATAYEASALAQGVEIKYQTLEPLTWSNGDGGYVNKLSPVQDGGWSIASKSENINAALKLFDFLYSPDGIALTSFGPAELEIHINKDGGAPKIGEKFYMHPKWLDPSIPFAQNVYFTTGLLQVLNAIWMQSDTDAENYPGVAEAISKISDKNQRYPYWEIPFNKLTTDQQRLYNVVITNTTDLAAVFFEKCIIGAADVDADWDSFVNDMVKMGINEILDVLNNIE